MRCYLEKVASPIHEPFWPHDKANEESDDTVGQWTNLARKRLLSLHIHKRSPTFYWSLTILMYQAAVFSETLRWKLAMLKKVDMSCSSQNVFLEWKSLLFFLSQHLVISAVPAVIKKGKEEVTEAWMYRICGVAKWRRGLKVLFCSISWTFYFLPFSIVTQDKERWCGANMCAYCKFWEG